MTDKKTKKIRKVKKVTPKTVKSTTVEKDPHEIIQNFQKLIIEADNYKGNDYNQFLTRIKKEGPLMLGITKAILEELEKSIKALGQAQTQVLQLTQKLEELKGDHGMLKK